MLKAAAERVTRQYAAQDYENPSYFDHRYSLGDATTSPPPLEVRPKQSFSPTQNNKERGVERPASTDTIPSISERNPSNTDWNSRKRSETSTRNSYVSNSYASSQRHAADPPRPAREGMEWVWFPEGYWAERERVELGSRTGESSGRGPSLKIGGSPKRWFNRSPSTGRRKSSAVAQKIPDLTANISEALAIPRLASTQRTGSYTSKASDAESRLEKLRMGFSYMSPTYPHFVSPTGEPEGLYCKTKRNVEGRLIPKRERVSIDEGSPFSRGPASQTTMVLEGASNYFERSERERSQRMRGHLEATTPMTPGSPGARSRRFGLAPWHRRTSFDSLFSVASSVHRLLQGKTPLATPDTASLYMGNDGHIYPKVDISGVGGQEPNFLPSEARRVNTPPMSPGTPDTIPRGFFSALTPVGRQSKSPTGSCSPGTASIHDSRSPISTHGDSPIPGSREWWEADPAHPLSPGKSTRKLLPMLGKGSPPVVVMYPLKPAPSLPFELNLPEHLPSSPLCPKHPRYIGKGNGVCVYHGRKKSVPLKHRIDSEATTATRRTTDTIEPRDIVKGDYET